MGHLDARTTTTRRLRRGMALAACTALLGLTACSAGDEAGTGDDGAQEPATATEEQSGGEQPSDDAGPGDDAETGDDAEVGDDQATDDQGETGGDEGAGDQEKGDPGAAGERTRILLVTDLGIDETSGDGAPTLANDDLAALLAEPFGGTAECADELLIETGQSAGCDGPTSPDDTAPTQEWVASTVAVPHEDALENGYRVALLFSTGTELPEEASELTQENVMLTGLGQGSMFGAEPLGAEEVADATLHTLTSENAYVPVAGMADWSEVTCENGLDFEEFGTTGCTAATAEGDSWQLHVAPGTFADGDQGLLVGIGSPTDV
ncbi:hypothetical protein HMPREF3159_13455 [Brachybacterium sp. HMSC06H03]|uniref:hypothetical protein n=1 Tax=Brachybacterium sp. HMSC06H03 TaxID=1581127 RepID=UPI0008A4F4F8|nr:hypothetical protein [Brachybacterium sp. HMSC06H03]OFT48291.1 hypothetical protein HMPREF3159_13455 [Brachybacterium sp. HMSC06H03]